MKVIFAFLSLLIAIPLSALDWHDSDEITRLFDEAGIEGTFVLYDTSIDKFIGHNRDRAQRRFIPASTFKIPNSLIGLATGAVESVDEALPYGGQPQPFEDWERDMGLRDAITLSNVPIYQELARRIGLENMRAHVNEMDYGNGQTGEVIDNFWLEGPLAISAVEQTRFLAKLAQNGLPFSVQHQEAVREILLIEREGDWTLYGKTGWENASNPGTGWWVGWVTRDERVYAFALNLDIRDPSDGPRRIELGKASLRALGVL